MHLRLAIGIGTGLLLLLLAVPPADAGSCARRHARDCTLAQATRSVDLNAVPDISKNIVLDEPAVAAKRQQSFDQDSSTPYTGPTLGVVPTMHRSATVGYRWALQ
jgi:hypothetical protein